MRPFLRQFSSLGRKDSDLLMNHHSNHQAFIRFSSDFFRWLESWQVICKISNDKPVFRVGGGFIGRVLWTYAHAVERWRRLSLDFKLENKTAIKLVFSSSISHKTIIIPCEQCQQLRPNCMVCLEVNSWHNHQYIYIEDSPITAD